MGKFTIEEIIGFHNNIIENSDQKGDEGQGGNIINYGNLSFVIDHSSYYSDPFDEAAYLLYGIVRGHPFVQGNKRLAFLLSALVLYETPECYTIICSDEEINNFVTKVAEGDNSLEDVSCWLKQSVKKGL